jgi:hypothetical protein
LDNRKEKEIPRLKTEIDKRKELKKIKIEI